MMIFGLEEYRKKNYIKYVQKKYYAYHEVQPSCPPEIAEDFKEINKMWQENGYNRKPRFVFLDEKK